VVGSTHPCRRVGRRDDFSTHSIVHRLRRGSIEFEGRHGADPTGRDAQPGIERCRVLRPVCRPRGWGSPAARPSSRSAITVAAPDLPPRIGVLQSGSEMDRIPTRWGPPQPCLSYEPEGCSPGRRGSQSRTACPSLTRMAAPPASSRSRRAQCLRSTGIRNARGSATTITHAARCLHRSPAGEARNRSASCRLRPIVSGRVLMSTSWDGIPLPRR
jgi:hypothetical protein